MKEINVNENASAASKKASDKRLFNAFCFTDVHNNWAMLEPTSNGVNNGYVVRKNVRKAVDIMLRDYGEMDVVFVGGDLMSDYPAWNESGWLPYNFYKGYKAELVKEFSRLAKGEKVHYVAGNHDYGQGEKYNKEYNELVHGGDKGPGKDGSYNSFEFYFTGPMDKTFGELPEKDMFCKISEHTGEKYLLAFYYEVKGIGIFGLAPDPDLIWYNQGEGFDPDCLDWLKAKLDEVDPDGNRVMFLNCHYVLNQRYLWKEDKSDKIFPVYGVDVRDKDFDVHNILTTEGYATYLAKVFNGHRNLFHLFGHNETWLRGYTSTAIFHYDADGKIIPFDTFKRSDSIGATTCENRGFNGVYMGHFRPLPFYSKGRYNNWPDSWFEDDVVEGYAGYNHKWAEPTTGTPKVAQGMYIEVYEDRVVFEMKNFGTFDGWRYEDKNEPYTLYLNK